MKKFILPAALILMVLMECSAFAAPKRIALMLEGADTASASGFNWLCLEGMRNAQVRFGNKKISTRYYNALDDKNKLLPLLKEAAASSDLVIITSVAYIKYLSLIHICKEIEKRSCMPFGGPVTVMLEGRHFAVSHSIAEHIEIESAGSRQIRGEREK